jgi:hypothetical protein
MQDGESEVLDRVETMPSHTINLMLKSIGEFPDHKAMIEAARRICHWLYNYNKLHSMMRSAIGGELVRWNLCMPSFVLQTKTRFQT